MDKGSFFIPNKAAFGSFPCQETVNKLELLGVTVFVDLTSPGERRITPYTTAKDYYSFPIYDGRTPSSWKNYACFLLKLTEIIKSLPDNEIIYIHCKGGHGRSGMVVACLLILLDKITVEKSIELTTYFHQQRPIMKEKWRYEECPHNKIQKNFVFKFFEPLYSFRSVSKGPTAGFSLCTPHSVHIKGVGNFPNADAAITACRNLQDKTHVNNLLSIQFQNKPPFRSGINELVNSSDQLVLPDPEEEMVLMVLREKFCQYPDLKRNILNTGFRPIIQFSRSGNYWCELETDNDSDTNSNKVGKLLEKLRLDFLYQEMVVCYPPVI